MQDEQKGENKEVDSGWVVRSSTDADSSAPNSEDANPLQAQDFPSVSWTASEYLAHQKSAGWFMLLAIASAAVAALVYLITREIISTIVVAITGLIMGIFAARQPRILEYRLDNKGLYIGSKFYPYASFKSFSVADDQALGYISLMPLKRFMPPLAIHYDPDDEEKVISTLANYLPMEEHKHDIIDQFTRRIRF